MSVISIDETSEYVIRHYDDCYLDSPLELKIERGNIIYKPTGETIVKTFPFTEEVKVTDESNINLFIKECVENKIPAYKSYEGSLLRVWYHNDKWNVSTYRRLDAFKSRWGSNSTYGQLFVQMLYENVLNIETAIGRELNKDEILESYFDTLDKNQIYIFQIRNGSQNRIACKGSGKPELYFIGCFEKDTWSFSNDMSEKLGIPLPERVQYESMEDIMRLINNPEWMKLDEFQGILFLDPKGKLTKMVPDVYLEKSKLRANVPNVLLRYAQLQIESRQTNNTEELNKFMELYEDQKSEFNDFDRVIKLIIKNIAKNYVNRFVHRQTVVVPNEQFFVMKNCHQLHVSTKKIITQKVVEEEVWRLTHGQLIHMFKTYQTREKEYGDGNYVAEDSKTNITKGFGRNK